MAASGLRDHVIIGGAVDSIQGARHAIRASPKDRAVTIGTGIDVGMGAFVPKCALQVRYIRASFWQGIEDYRQGHSFHSVEMLYKPMLFPLFGEHPSGQPVDQNPPGRMIERDHMHWGTGSISKPLLAFALKRSLEFRLRDRRLNLPGLKAGDSEETIMAASTDCKTLGVILRTRHHVSHQQRRRGSAATTL